jgi:hypothetical protein
MSDSNSVEVISPIGEEIVAREWAERSDEGAAQHSHNTKQAEAEAAKAVPDRSFGDTLKQAIRAQKPMLSEQDLKDIQAEKGEQQKDVESEEDLEVEVPEEEQEAEINPLDAFSPEAVAKLAQQFGLSEDDLQSPAVQRMLADRLQGAEQPQQNEVNPPVTQAAQSEQEFRQHLEEIGQIAQDPELNDPRMVQAFESVLGQVFGSDTPEQQQSVKTLSNVLIEGGLSLMTSAVPRIVANLLPAYFEQLAPGLMEQHRSATAHNTWSDLKASNPDYRGLPDVDTPEFDALREKILQENPWMSTLQFKDSSGNALNPWHPQAVRQQAALFAKLAVGERLSADAVRKALETGRKEAQAHTRRVAASRSMSAGRSTGKFGVTPKNEFRDFIEQYMRDQRPSFDGE